MSGDEVSVTAHLCRSGLSLDHLLFQEEENWCATAPGLAVALAVLCLLMLVRNSSCGERLFEWFGTGKWEDAVCAKMQRKERLSYFHDLVRADKVGLAYGRHGYAICSTVSVPQVFPLMVSHGRMVTHSLNTCAAHILHVMSSCAHLYHPRHVLASVLSPSDGNGVCGPIGEKERTTSMAGMVIGGDGDDMPCQRPAQQIGEEDM